MTGAEIVDVLVSGAATGSSGSGLLDTPDLSWSGCTYKTADDSEFTVAELTATSDGPGALEQFESVRALAGVHDRVRSIVADLGEEAFVTHRGEIVVFDGKKTFRFRVDVTLDVSGISFLADVAEGLLAVTETDTSGRCSALVGLVPEEWGQPADAVGDGGTENGFTLEICVVRPSAFEGGTLAVDIAEGRDWYDFELADEAPRVPVLVDDIGDVAYAYGPVNGFVVLVGNRALVVSGEDANEEALELAALESGYAEHLARLAGLSPR